MAYSFISDEFLDYLKQSGMIPSSQINYTDDYLLTITDYQIVSVIAPLLKSVDNSFYVEETDYSFVSGQATYNLPEFAMWNSVKQVDKVYLGNLIPLTRITSSQVSNIDISANSEPVFYYIQGNQSVFAPTPNAVGSKSFRVKYWRRPGKLVNYEIKDNTGAVTGYGAARVQSVNYATGAVTYEQTPSVFTYTASSVHDFYSATSPYMRTQTRVQASAIAANVQTFPIASVANLVKGDYVNVTGETVFTAIPNELREMLVKLVLKQIAKSQMDMDRYQAEAAEIMDHYKMAQKSPGDRIMSQPIAMTLGRKVNWRGGYW